MANIKAFLEQIANAIYGEEVRSSIINALDQVNSAATDSAAAASNAASAAVENASAAASSALNAATSKTEAAASAAAAEASAKRAEASSGVSVATTQKAGIVKPDGTTITVDADGSISVGGAITNEIGAVKDDLANHSHTAEDVGALPLTGGTISNELVVSNAGASSVRLVSTDNQRRTTVQQDEDLTYILNSSTKNNEYFGLAMPASESLANKLRFLVKTPDASTVWYKVFGEHNKPSGQYSGNGSVSKREIPISNSGNGDFLYIIDVTTGTNFAIVSYSGALLASGGTVTKVARSVAYFEYGKLYINSNSNALNASGTTYYYTVK